MKIKKQFFVIGLLLALLLIPTGAFAGQGISIQLNGSDMHFVDAKPINQNSRVYVPFRVVFENMDASVDYEDGSRTITAIKGDTTVKFVVGNPNITVNGQTIKTDAASFIRGSRTYVPVRFAAQSLGIKVGWDQAEQSVVMVDRAQMEQMIPGAYHTMDAFMEYLREQKAQTLNVNGDMNLDMKLAVKGKNGVKHVPVTGAFDLTGSSKGNLSNLNLSGSMDMDAYQKALKEAGKLRDEDVHTAEAMKNVQMKLIANGDLQKVYLKSPVFALNGLDAKAWYQMNQEDTQMQESFGPDAFQRAADYDSFETFVTRELATLPLENAKYCKAFLSAMEGYRDIHFVDNGSEKRAVIAQGDQSAEDVVLTLKTAGNRVNGYEQKTITYVKGVPISTLTVNGDRNTESVHMTMNIAGTMTVDFKGTMHYTSGSQIPVGMPPAGEKVVVLQN